MNLHDTRLFHTWLDQANEELTASVAERLDVEAALAEVKRRASAASRAVAPVPPSPTAGDRLDIGGAVNGDPHAIAQLLGYIRPLVVRYCRARVGLLVSADDVAQEVCLAVLTALPGYRDQGRSFLAFVYGIAAHKVADARRLAARTRSETVSAVPDRPESAAGPEQRALQAELLEQTTHLLHLLTDTQREVIVLRVMVGLSTEETAEAVGSTPGAVRVAQHRALLRLREVLTAAETTGKSV